MCNRLCYNIASSAAQSHSVYASMHHNPIVPADSMCKFLCQNVFSHSGFDLHFHRQCYKIIGSCF